MSTTMDLSTTSLLIFFGGVIGIVLVILLSRWLFNVQGYPSKKIEIDITKKKKMSDDELLDFYIINTGTQVIEEHLKNIEAWKTQKINKCNNNQEKINKFYEKCNRNSYKAFYFKGIRKQTRYKQYNYQKSAYQITIVTNCFKISDDKVIERINFLKEHDYYVTHNNYEKKNQRNALTKALRENIKERDNFTCQICGKYMPDEVGLHIDHIVPIAKGGKSIPTNLRVLCSKCNGQKGSK